MRGSRTYVITVDKPLSTNEAYIVNKWKRTRHLLSHASDYKQDIKDMLWMQDLLYYEGEKFSARYLDVTFIFFMTPGDLFHYKSKDKLARKDVKNMLGLPEDALSEYLGIDDKNNLCIRGFKILSDVTCLVMIVGEGELFKYPVGEEIGIFVGKDGRGLLSRIGIL